MEPAEQARVLIILGGLCIGSPVLIYWVADHVLNLKTPNDDDIRMVLVCTACASLVLLVSSLITVYGMLRMKIYGKGPAGDRTKGSVRPSEIINSSRSRSRQGPNAAWMAELDDPTLAERLAIARDRLNAFREAHTFAAEEISQEVEADHKREIDLIPENNPALEVHPSPQGNIPPEAEAGPEFCSILDAIPDDLDGAAVIQPLMDNILLALHTERAMNAEWRGRVANGDPEAVRRVEGGLDRTRRLLQNMIGELRATERGFGAVHLPVDEYMPGAEADPDAEVILGAAMRATPDADLIPRPAVAGSTSEMTTGANCVVCNEDKNRSDVVQAPCKHFLCRVCFHYYVQAATRDESLYPPICCNEEIPLSVGLHFLEFKVVEQYRKKAEEFATSDRTYCNRPTCSAFIPLAHIQLGVATCPECRSETCSVCNGTPHNDSQCPEVLEETEIIGAEDWVRCPNCRRIIELEGGCNHVTYGTIPNPTKLMLLTMY
jgi:hypothetical protein